MHFAAAIALLTGLVAAQTTTGASSPQSTECPALPIVENCLASTQARVSACTANNWTCLCAAQEAVVTCYNNCPNDPRASSANSVRIQYCQAAQQQNPTSSVSRASTSTAATSTASRASSSSASASSGAAAVAVAASGSGLFALAAGVAALI